MNCQERGEEIIRLTTIRTIVKVALRIVQDCAFPSCGQLPRGPRRARTPTAERELLEIAHPSNQRGIVKGVLVTDTREAYESLSTLFSHLAALRKAEESDEAALERITKFMDALRGRRSLAGPAKALCKSLRDAYRLGKKVELSRETKFLLDHDEYYDAIPCFAGAAAYEYFYENRDRSVTSKEIVEQVRPCNGSVESLDDKLDKLHPVQRARLRGNKKGGRFFASD